jgi:type I restriction enzyme R subunit
LLCGIYVDRRLGGIQAVQTLSRLNRAHPGKDTTYVVDFVNEPEKILEAFQLYHTTAALADISNPNVVLDLRNKLEATGYYDRFEAERVARVAVKPKAAQSELDAAIGPVSNWLLTRFKQAQASFRAAPEKSSAWKAAKDEMDALVLFKRDLGSHIRVYEFLGQMFDYGNTDYEKLYLFAKMLLPLLEYGREREGLDLSVLRLTHHRMRDLGQQKLNLSGSETDATLAPVTQAGSGQVQDKHKQRLQEIISAMNDLFEGEITEGDAVAYVDTVIKGKMLESDLLRSQAMANTREQFGNSPHLGDELMNAIMDAMAAHQTMSRQALNSDNVRGRILATLLGPGQLWEALRASEGQSATV